MRNNKWKYAIYKELKGPSVVERISEETRKIIKRFGDFYLEDPNVSYIHIYGVDMEPMKLPKYVNNNTTIFEFMRKINY